MMIEPRLADRIVRTGITHHPFSGAARMKLTPARHSWMRHSFVRYLPGLTGWVITPPIPGGILGTGARFLDAPEGQTQVFWADMIKRGHYCLFWGF